jgi:hypothetical protein
MTMGNVPPSLSAVATAIAAANTKKHDGVRIKAPHYLEQHDEHRSWTSNKTWHFETGWVYHVTAGQVLHQNLNLAEIHTTSNLMTMHLDITPLNVHIGQKLLAFDVHIEPSRLHKQINVHGGPVKHVMNEFEQRAQEVTLTSTSKALDFFEKTVLNHPAKNPGKMTFKADGLMSLKSNASIRLESPYIDPVSLSLNAVPGQAILTSTTTTVRGTTQANVAGGGSFANVGKGNIELNNARGCSVVLNGNTLTTNATNTHLNAGAGGKVYIGQPAIAGMATTVALETARADLAQADLENLAELNKLREIVLEMI